MIRGPSAGYAGLNCFQHAAPMCNTVVLAWSRRSQRLTKGFGGCSHSWPVCVAADLPILCPTIGARFRLQWPLSDCHVGGFCWSPVTWGLDRSFNVTCDWTCCLPTKSAATTSLARHPHSTLNSTHYTAVCITLASVLGRCLTKGRRCTYVEFMHTS